MNRMLQLPHGIPKNIHRGMADGQGGISFALCWNMIKIKMLALPQYKRGQVIVLKDKPVRKVRFRQGSAVLTWHGSLIQSRCWMYATQSMRVQRSGMF